MRSAAAQTALLAAAVPYVLFEAAYETLASFGRDRFLDVVAPHPVAFGTLHAIVLVGLAAGTAATAAELHAARRQGTLDDARALRALSLALAWLLLGSRFPATPLGAAARGLDAFGAYGTLASTLDTRPYVACAALGIPFAALHAFLAGRLVLARRLGAARSSAVAGALGTVLLVALADATAWFAIGRTFLPR